MAAAEHRAYARRADAQQNRLRILAAARSALSDPDADVSMAEISRQAGVGMATLYRNFPGKHELLEALYSDEVDAICRAVAASGGTTEGDRFMTWLRAFFLFVRSKRQVASELLEYTDRSDPVFGGSRARVTAAASPLLASAQQSGDIRSDVSLDQVLDMIHAVAMIRGDQQYLDPILSSALEGLRAAG